MFSKKHKIGLNQSTLAATEICRQALTCIFGTDFNLKTMEVIFESPEKQVHETKNLTITAHFSYQLKVFTLKLTTSIVKKVTNWEVSDMFYGTSAKIYDFHQFNFRGVGGLNISFTSLRENMRVSEFKQEYGLV